MSSKTSKVHDVKKRHHHSPKRSKHKREKPDTSSHKHKRSKHSNSVEEERPHSSKHRHGKSSSPSRKHTDTCATDQRHQASKSSRRDVQPPLCKAARDGIDRISGNNSEEEKDFSFEKYKYELNLIFFRDEDIIKYGSEEYHDFWRFLRKYDDMQKKTGKKFCDSGPPLMNEELGIPVEFDKRYLVSISLSASLDELMSRIPPRDRDTGRWLPQRRVTEFRDVLMLYLDFKQKEKFKKFKKLRESQANLPVAQYR